MDMPQLPIDQKTCKVLVAISDNINSIITFASIDSLTIESRLENVKTQLATLRWSIDLILEKQITNAYAEPHESEIEEEPTYIDKPLETPDNADGPHLAYYKGVESGVTYSRTGNAQINPYESENTKMYDSWAEGYESTINFLKVPRPKPKLEPLPE